MCGIAGLVSGQRDKTIDQSIIKQMCDMIIHRGPDSEGFFVERNIGLGMRRLSIIDLNTGFQPIFNEDKSICIVFNGEIYNYQNLREKLVKNGHNFKTKSDTETIVHLYEEKGFDCVKDLRGMFAFAIWDQKKELLFIARDRLGIKPLFYKHTDEDLYFGSELKSILKVLPEKPSINENAIDDYFSYLYVPQPRTIYNSISRLAPAHYLVYQNKKVTTKCYWELSYNESIYKKEDDYIDHFFEVFEESVRLRMISDVPLGAFLSGGIDSSLIVAAMSKYSSKPVETFSIAYKGNGSSFNETPYARMVSEKYNTNHHEFELTPEKVKTILPKINSFFDEPFADASAIPNYLLAKETRKFVTVSLSGLGGDELAGGYERYLGVLLGEKLSKIPFLFNNDGISRFVNNLPDSKKGLHFNNRLKRFFNSASYGFPERYYNIVSTFSNEDKLKLYSNDLRKNITNNSFDIYLNYMNKYAGRKNILNEMLFLDMNTYLVGDLLTLTDRMTMAHSLEARVPFLDHKMLEFFASIPTKLKIKGFSKKYILKKAAERVLPKEVIYRKKMGFSVPLVVWIRQEMKEYFDHALFDANKDFDKYFNRSYLNQVFNEHLSQKANHDEKLWAIINFNEWYNKYSQLS